MPLWPGMKMMLCGPVGLYCLSCACWLQHPPVSGLNSLPQGSSQSGFPTSPPLQMAVDLVLLQAALCI